MHLPQIEVIAKPCKSMWTTNKIRRTFLDYFRDKEHQIVSSAPLVVKNDPTLMFINAGMNQFKDVFLGNEKPLSPRVADTQKCLRVSGKHNDLEEVGVDTYHHTLFEMLGNWSFNDYFKKEAIDYAWDLLVNIYGIDQDRMYATVFGGDEKDGTEADEEAFSIWTKYLPEDRILRCGKKDNFWEMGDVGPSGPCSEIHIDVRSNAERAKIPGVELVNADHPQVIEVWNLVFIQFNRLANGSLEKLSSVHVDTGMGLERLAMVLQGKESNYEIDLFQKIISSIENLSGQSYSRSDSKSDIAFRVIADHIRAISFAIADGQLPSNTGAGYVIRRILRRAVRYAYSFLGFREPALSRLVLTLVEEMGDAFPELRDQQEFITKVIHEEEEGFLRTLENGLTRLKTLISSNGKIDGRSAFELYDTYGFPIDLTQLICSEEGIEVDEVGFRIELNKQKDRSRTSNQLELDDWVEINPAESTSFVGYDDLETNVSILKYRKVVKKGKDFFQLVLNKTPFYPEGGGQVGDKGVLVSGNGERVEVIDTQRENELIVHFTKKLPAELQSHFTAKVDNEKRKSTELNHSATHLLHYSLRKVLGKHVEQRGSLVNDKYLRFDFSHFQKMSEDEIAQVEAEVNRMINENLPLDEKRSVPIEEARKSGAMSLFGEKYGDEVRVIQFGDSIELCGGTHVHNTISIRHFKILSEASVASGVRRIEAITGSALDEHYHEQEHLLNEIKVRLNDPKNLLKAIGDLLEREQLLEKELAGFKSSKAKQIKEELLKEIEKCEGYSLIVQQVELSADQVKDISFQLGSQVSNLIIALGYENNGKPGLSIWMDKDLVSENRNASHMIREAGKFIKGGGGGQAFYATAGGKDLDGIPKALEFIKQNLK